MSNSNLLYGYQISQSDFFNILSLDSDGIFSVVQKRESGAVTNKMYSPDELAENTFSEANQYVSLNAFVKKAERRKENISEIRCFFSDLDCEPSPAQETLEKLVANEFGKNIPYPTIVTFSGRGLHLIWRIAPVGAERVNQWDNIQRAIRKTLVKYGSDSRCVDAARVLRIPGTINPKPGANREVRSYANCDAFYSFDDFAEWFNIGENCSTGTSLYKAEKKKARVIVNIRHIKRTNDSVSFFPEEKLKKSIALKKAQDIADILIAQKEEVVGHREVGLFWFRYFCEKSGISFEQAEQLTLRLNQELYAPLRESEAKNNTKVPVGKNYNPSNQRIADDIEADAVALKKCRIIMTTSEKERREQETSKIKFRKKIASKLKAYKVLRLIRCEKMSVVKACEVEGISRSIFYHDLQKIFYKKNEELEKRLRAIKFYIIMCSIWRKKCPISSLYIIKNTFYNYFPLSFNSPAHFFDFFDLGPPPPLLLWSRPPDKLCSSA